MTAPPDWLIQLLAGYGAYCLIRAVVIGGAELLRMAGARANAGEVEALRAELAKERARDDELEARVDQTVDRLEEFMERLRPHMKQIEARPAEPPPAEGER